MIRRLKNNRMNILNSDLLDMIKLVESQICDSVEALKKQDILLAKKVIQGDDDVDLLQKRIEEDCIKFIATESPLAIDLRRIYTTSKIVTDLERMADHAVDICKIVLRRESESYIDEISPIWEMLKVIRIMLDKVIDAYMNGDAALAYEISNMDNELDELFNNMFSVVLKKMSEDGELIQQGTQMLFISKHLERIGDYITNLCEWIIFSVEGEYVDLNE